MILFLPLTCSITVAAHALIIFKLCVLINPIQIKSYLVLVKTTTHLAILLLVITRDLHSRFKLHPSSLREQDRPSDPPLRVVWWLLEERKGRNGSTSTQTQGCDINTPPNSHQIGCGEQYSRSACSDTHTDLDTGQIYDGRDTYFTSSQVRQARVHDGQLLRRYYESTQCQHRSLTDEFDLRESIYLREHAHMCGQQLKVYMTHSIAEICFVSFEGT
ncbi:hypothetical protein FHG87_018318 [Trinorchestia longiramus]|nr:hypothetical protein FHG87_018318 [Trinorchestia longiramus]